MRLNKFLKINKTLISIPNKVQELFCFYRYVYSRYHFSFQHCNNIEKEESVKLCPYS